MRHPAWAIFPNEVRVADGSGKRPLVSGALLKALRRDILARNEGENLGSEQELLQKLKVGRSTLRQAARILEQEQLLTVRRGVRGGYFTRRPDESAVAQAAALYLALRKATLHHMMEVGRILNVEAFRKAAMSDNAEFRDALAATIAELKASAHDPMDIREFLARSEKFRRAVYRLTENPFLELFAGITYLFGGGLSDERLMVGHPERMSAVEQLHFRQAEAVLNGEPDVAAALCAHSSRLVEGWARASAGDPALPPP